MRRLDLPPIWLAAFLLAGWLQSRLVHLLEFGRPGNVVGILIVAAGLALTGLAATEFSRHRTTIVPHRQPTVLVRTGVFRRSRHPIYLADLLILTGAGLIWSAPLALALVPVLFVVLDRRFVRPEERRLAEVFGDEYAAWARQTRRWL